MSKTTAAEVLRCTEVIPADTTPEAWRIQAEIYRRMSPNRRLEKALEMGAFLREVVAAGIRYRHPDYDERQVTMAAARLRLGDELFRKVYPDVDVAP